MMLKKYPDHSDLEEYLRKFNTVIREMKTADISLEDLEIVCYLRMSMSESYSSIGTAIEASCESPKYEEVKEKLLDHY